MTAQDMSTPPVRGGLLKVSLTDFISGKYSLSYERVIGIGRLRNSPSRMA